MADIKTLAEQLVNLTVKEVNKLAKVLKEEYGIEPAAAAAVVAAGPVAAAAFPILDFGRIGMSIMNFSFTGCLSLT